MATYTYKDRIRDLRKKAGITQDDLAVQIGVSRFSVSNWELGKHPPNADELLYLSNRFNVSVDYILGRTDWECDFTKNISPKELCLVEKFLEYIRDVKSISK